MSDDGTAHYKITVWIDAEIGDAAADAVFCRIAEVLHADDIRPFCSMRGPVPVSLKDKP